MDNEIILRELENLKNFVSQEIDNLKGFSKGNANRLTIMEDKVSNLQVKTSEDRVQVNNLIASMNEVKLSVNKILDKMDNNAQKPSALLWGVGGTVLGALLVKALISGGVL